MLHPAATQAPASLPAPRRQLFETRSAFLGRWISCSRSPNSTGEKREKKKERRCRLRCRRRRRRRRRYSSSSSFCPWRAGRGSGRDLKSDAQALSAHCCSGQGTRRGGERRTKRAATERPRREEARRRPRPRRSQAWRCPAPPLDAEVVARRGSRSQKDAAAARLEVAEFSPPLTLCSLSLPIFLP